MTGSIGEAVGTASLALVIAGAVAIIAAGRLCSWRAALCGLGLALLAGLVLGHRPTLLGASLDADRVRLGLTLLLCGAVPATMAWIEEMRARPPAGARPLAVPLPSRRRGRSGASR